MIQMSLTALEPTGFVSTALLGLPAREKISQHLIETLSIDARQDPAIGHLTRHLLSLESKVSRNHLSSMTNPFCRSTEGGLSCQFGQQ
jgi:hypothetical protein